MSDLTKCDVCETTALRRTSQWAPEGWFYGLSYEEEEGRTIVVWVCSEKCRDGFFKTWDTGRVLDEPRDKPTGAHLRARLHALLDDFSIQRILKALAHVVDVTHRAGGNPCKPFRWTEPVPPEAVTGRSGS